MIVVPPLTLRDTMLTSTAVEPNAPADYAAGTTYAEGAQVTDPATHIAYQSLVSNNTGNAPSASPDFWEQIGYKEVAYVAGTTYGDGDVVYSGHRVYLSLQAANTGNTPLTSPTWWQDIGPTNKFASFDLLRNTATVAASPLTIVLTPGVRTNTIGFVGVVADTVRVRVSSAGVTVYDTTQNLVATSFIDNWYEYFFAKFEQKDAALFTDLPPYTNMIVTVDLTRAVGNVSCGGVVLGTAENLGAIQYDPVDDAENFSTIDRTVFGDSVLIPRRSVPKTNQITWLASSEVKNVRRVRESLNAVPALWAGIEDDTSDYFDSVLILGIYKQFSINLTFTDTAVLTLELEEV